MTTKQLLECIAQNQSKIMQDSRDSSAQANGLLHAYHEYMKAKSAIAASNLGAAYDEWVVSRRPK